MPHGQERRSIGDRLAGVGDATVEFRKLAAQIQFDVAWHASGCPNSKPVLVHERDGADDELHVSTRPANRTGRT
jgi:hypothetical protein